MLLFSPLRMVNDGRFVELRRVLLTFRVGGLMALGCQIEPRRVTAAALNVGT